MKHWQQIFMKIASLLTVKTLITLAIVFTLCIKTLRGLEMSDAFIMIATAVITYYFCKDNNAKERVREHEKNLH